MYRRIVTVLDRARQPEYTGQNRCIPCTIVNVVLTLIAGSMLVVLSPILGMVGITVGLCTIYLRGYVVPGTPTLTERYLPDWFLRYFDHGVDPDSDNNAVVSMEGDSDETDSTSVLQAAGLIEPCQNGSDLCLSDEFATAWRRRATALREADYPRILSEWLDRDRKTLSIERNGSVRVIDGDRQMARWVSEAAMLADLAAIPELQSRYSRWEEMDVSEQGQLLYSLRMFLDECFVCGGDATMAQSITESCCRSSENITIYCDDCDRRLVDVRI